MPQPLHNKDEQLHHSHMHSTPPGQKRACALSTGAFQHSGHGIILH